MNKKAIWGLGILGVGAAAAYFGRRWYLAARNNRSHLFDTVEDEHGNYDIDGVSFDRENSEVIVSGDNTHGENPRRAALLH